MILDIDTLPLKSPYFLKEVTSMKDIASQDIHRALLAVRANSTLKGFDQAVCAVSLVIQDEDLLKRVTRELYPQVEKMCGAPKGTVERNLRTLISQCWADGGKIPLELMAKRELEEKPKPVQFIEIIAVHLIRK